MNPLTAICLPNPRGAIHWERQKIVAEDQDNIARNPFTIINSNLKLIIN